MNGSAEGVGSRNTSPGAVTWIFVFFILIAGTPVRGAAVLSAGLSESEASMEASQAERKSNRLINEKSPYLIQHAYNPVDWYPWGEEAFEKARREDKPILVSIGYSTCHWCHVMEDESFTDRSVAALMNENLVCIKVDREERPAVDKIYITAVSALSGSAGWPLNVFLTHDLKPFYGGTYFPPSGGYGRPGWSDVIERIGRAWRSPGEREKLISSADGLTRTLEQHLSGGSGSTTLDAGWLDHGIRALQSSFDPVEGGFGPAPKFPMPVNHNFLMHCYARTEGVKGGDGLAAEALEISHHTLRKMARGGIYDQVGGGFHRYSTDAHWHIPHFEKMLYDNAQLARNYIEAYRITGDNFFADIARETLDYVLRDMTHPDGGFYSAEDADSLTAGGEAGRRKIEGAFYGWEAEEIRSVLGATAADIFEHQYGVKPDGNVLYDPRGEFEGKNILFADHSAAETAQRFGRTEEDVRRIVGESRAKLFEARNGRPRPHLDDKVITSWNGLMITALALAHQVFGEPKYLSAAQGAAAFVRANLYDTGQKRLYRRWRDGEKKIMGTADDYAFLAQGLIDLYEASFDPAWLDWAVELTEEELRLFYDADVGGFFMTSPDYDENIIVRVKENVDNVEPSAGSVATMNLLRLSQYMGRKEFREAAEKTLGLFGAQMSRQPTALPQMLVALDFALAEPFQVVIVGDPGLPATAAMLDEVRRRFIPNKILIVIKDDAAKKDLSGRLPFVENLSKIDEKPTAYVCIDYACRLPTNDVSVLGRQLDGEKMEP